MFLTERRHSKNEWRRTQTMLTKRISDARWCSKSLTRSLLVDYQCLRLKALQSNDTTHKKTAAVTELVSATTRYVVWLLLLLLLLIADLPLSIFLRHFLQKQTRSSEYVKFILFCVRVSNRTYELCFKFGLRSVIYFFFGFMHCSVGF